MYLDFYQLTDEPFHITPDPRFLFLSPSHKEALGSIIYGIEKRKGFISIIGEVGVGKTTILRSYLEDRTNRKKQRIIYIFNTNVSFRSLLKTISSEFSIYTDPADDVSEMVDKLHKVLIDEYTQGHNVIVILDEAQNVPLETLENLRMLSNLETSTEKLIQIVLIGQPELQSMLDRAELRQLKQRIAIRSNIYPLTYKESVDYIQHRLSRVGATSGPVFSPRAIKLIAQEAKGIPRIINILCDNGLIAGLGYKKKPVTRSIMKEVIADFTGKKKWSSLSKWWLVPGGSALCLAAVLLVDPYADQPFRALEMLKNSKTAFTRSVSQESGQTLLTPPSSPLHAEVSPEPTKLPLISEESPEKLADAPKEATQNQDNQQDIVAREELPVAVISNDEKMSLDSSVGDPNPPSVEVVALPEQNVDSIPEAATSDMTIKPGETVRIVQKGENLIKLITDTYGFVDARLIESVRRLNPQIRNVNRIMTGERLLLPAPHSVAFLPALPDPGED